MIVEKTSAEIALNVASKAQNFETAATFSLCVCPLRLVSVRHLRFVFEREDFSYISHTFLWLQCR